MFARAVHFISKSTCFLVAVPSHRCRSNLRRSGLFHWQCSRPETARTHQTALVLIPLAVLPPRNRSEHQNRTGTNSTGSAAAPKPRTHQNRSVLFHWQCRRPENARTHQNRTGANSSGSAARLVRYCSSSSSLPRSTFNSFSTFISQ